MSLDVHIHVVRCDTPQCLAAFYATVTPGAPEGTAQQQAERIGWRITKHKPFDVWDDPFAPPEPEDLCPACQAGRGPVTATGTCCYCGGRTTVRTGTCRWCDRPQPEPARDRQETPQ
ncbi:hypothetical protein ACGF07_31885 [Kitasatospora sp. NPDC048194]|uniref:hypothetical protein n=1 Tax=Kitasatospora sp. NPDC048194 TaxID=3364045 RepID=UPI00371230F5